MSCLVAVSAYNVSLIAVLLKIWVTIWAVVSEDRLEAATELWIALGFDTEE